MRLVVLRMARILIVALAASLVLAWASARGLDWLGWSVALALFAGLLGLALLRQVPLSRAARERRWEAALAQPRRRPQAILELQRALRRLEPPRVSRRAEHARLAVLLAELLDAEGRCDEAMGVVDAVPLGALSAIDAALVRHTRAVTHLRAADADGALRALEGRAASGDLELDQRLGLLETYARLELGEAQSALTQAGKLENAPGVDESVVLEARVVRAAALDALGRREEALVTLAALGRDSLVPLADLGQPRVRALAKLALELGEA
jgi:tetratricopeptide (TPR) repeat protein